MHGEELKMTTDDKVTEETLRPAASAAEKDASPPPETDAAPAPLHGDHAI
jgi:hypothetical protein